MKRLTSILTLLLLAAFCGGCASKQASTPEVSKEQRIVDRSTEIVRAELAGEQGEDVRKFIARAKGILIMPNMGNLSFLFSVGSGQAALLVRTDKGWTGPIFLSKLEGGVGLQAGVTSTSGFVLFMHDDDVRYVIETGMVLQGNANAVFLDADMEFNRTPAFFETRKTVFVGKREGMYLGLALNGGGFTNRDSMTAEYHGVEDGSPENILYKSATVPVGAQALCALLNSAGEVDESVAVQ